MAWDENKVAAYEQMIVALRQLISGENGSVEEVPTHFLADLDQIITETEVAVAGGHQAFAPWSDPADQARPAAKLLARWLWDRNLRVVDIAHAASRVAAAAGVDVVPQTWIIAANMISTKEERAKAEPESPSVVRHHLDDRDQWVAPTKPTADPFRHGSTAEANRLAKAKQLARWLWDRNIDSGALLGFTDKYRREIARAAGVNPPSSLTTWNAACNLIDKMEVREVAEPNAKAVIRHHLDEHEKWVTDPHTAKAA